MNQTPFKSTMIIFLVALALSTPTIGTLKTTLVEQQQEVAIAPRPTPSVEGLYPKTHVYFHNLLGNGLTMSYHPKSHYWDFGLRLVADGQIGEIIFHPFLIPAVTDIRCDLSKQNGTAIVWVYRCRRDFKRCYKTCHWLLTPNGIYGINKHAPISIINGLLELILQFC